MGGFVGGDVDAEPAGEGVDRRLHRVAEGDPATVALHGPTGRAPSGGPRQQSQRGHDGGVGDERRGRVVTGAGDVGRAGWCPHLDHGHLVAGEGAGLVGADERGRTERLDRLQTPNEGVAAGHALRAHRQATA